MRFVAVCTLLLLCCAVDCGGRIAEDTAANTQSGPGDDPPLPLLPIRAKHLDKVDLLLMIDNSQSMGDKQSELGRRIPAFIKALTNPDVDPATGKAAYKTVADLHVGVITSSLGSYGTSACDPSNPHNDDRGHLLKRPGDTLPATGWRQPADVGEPLSAPCPGGIADASPLTWTVDASITPGGEYVGAPGSDAMEVATSCVVESAREDGCGYENQLESIYHFLVDPTPWHDAKVDCTFGTGGDDCGKNTIAVTGLDDELLAQRAAFLRPDSVLAIVMVTDENDASLEPAALNWIPWGYAKGQMQPGWAACGSVPDDFEPDDPTSLAKLRNDYGCASCADDLGDVACSSPWATGGPNRDTDDRNLRAFHQVQRFGKSVLWGRQRYVDGFSKGEVPGRDASGAIVSMPNPIFAGGLRTPDLVVVTGLLGVPLDLVTDSSTGMAKRLSETEWAKIISADLSQRDPRMIESIAPRAGRPKYKGGGDLSADPPDAPTFGNGGDRDVESGQDLQYACIAKRSDKAPSFDCVTDLDFNDSPLCTPDKHQPYFKAYPTLRELRVIHDLGVSGLVGSICNHTYAPAVQGILDKVQATLDARCLQQAITIDPDGRVDCLVEEVFAPDAGGTTCEALGPGYCTPGAAPCRVPGTRHPPVDPGTAASGLTLAITVVADDGTATNAPCKAFSDGANVYVGGTPGCGSARRIVCEERQIADDASCLNDPSYALTDKDPGSGWCYTQNAAAFDATCAKIGAAAMLRFLGNVAPREGSEVFPICHDH
jgi:hypothetical protein